MDEFSRGRTFFDDDPKTTLENSNSNVFWGD
jgi:hypothetical protein